MARKKSAEPTEAQISEVMRAMGSRGGKVKGVKGLAAMSPERRAAIRKKALDTRLRNKAAKLASLK